MVSVAARPDGSLVEWLPIMPFDLGRKSLVLDLAGRWAWAVDPVGKNQLHGFQEPEAIGALPILERDPGSLGETMTPAASSIGISVEQLILSLPDRPLVQCAFRTRSDYWIERALEWAERWDRPERPSAALEALVDESQVRQDLRHRARRLIVPGFSS